MADAGIFFENQLADLVEWLLLGVDIPIAVIIGILALFGVLLYLVLRKGGREGAEVTFRGDIASFEKGMLELPGQMVDIDLHVDRVTIKLLSPTPEAEPGEVEEGPEPAEETPSKPEPVSDINAVVSALAEKHHLDSITIANNEGLVVASTSKTPEEDAAEAAEISASNPSEVEKWTETEEGSYVLHIIHREKPLYIHFRSQETPSEAVVKDLKTSVGHTLP
jgi:hypothetical protein